MYEPDSVITGVPRCVSVPGDPERSALTSERVEPHHSIKAPPDSLRRTLGLARRALKCREALVLPPEQNISLGAMLSADIVPEDKVVACLVVRDEPGRQWSDDDWAMVRDLAEGLAVEIRLTSLVSRLEARQPNTTGTMADDLGADLADDLGADVAKAPTQAAFMPDDEAGLPPDEDTFHILLADDLDLNRKLICDMLSLDGYVVDSVADGAAAVEAVKAKAYDLVLMDMIMPGMDGMEATRAIRALPAPTCDVPIVALTAHSFREQLDNCLHAGMNATLTKPMSFDALSSAVSTWARSRRRAA